MQELHIFIGQLNALQNLDLNNCSNLQELPTSIGHLNALQNLDLKYYSSLQELPTSMVNWVDSKTLIWTIVWTYKNYLNLLANWLHYKTLILTIFELPIITYLYWSIECIWKSWFEQLFELAGISCTSIGYFNATQKLHLLVHAFKVDQK
jgi:Leucine-rich repeat (LRR) protein